MSDIKSTLNSLSKTERQELGKCYTNPIRYAKILPKYQTLIDRIMESTTADTLAEAIYLITNDMSAAPWCKACDSPLVYKTTTYTYGEYCNHSCRAAFNNAEAIQISIDGQVYDKMIDAVNQTGISRFNIKNRLMSSAYPEYRYVGDHDAICLEHIRKIHPSLVDRKILEDWRASGSTLESFAQSLGKSISTVGVALAYHGIDGKYEQIPDQSVREFLINQEEFTKEFDSMSIEAMAKKYGVMDGTIRKHALNYGLETGRRGFNRSSGEMELFDFVKTIREDAMSSQTPLKNARFEADIFIKDMNIGIEYNGVYIHSERFKENNYHKTKVDAFANEGIRIIQIWEDTWETKRLVVKKFLTNILGTGMSRIGARKTQAVVLTKDEFDSFMNANHLQGTASCSIMLGLMYDSQLVSAMGFAKLPSNTQKHHDGEGALLSRFANINVTGGFSKLVDFFHQQYPNYTHITSFADMETSSSISNVYLKNGFVETHQLAPDYKYFNPKTKVREHKFNYRKSFFEAAGILIDGKTEAELATEYGLLRCYDSGKIHYLKVFWVNR